VLVKQLYELLLPFLARHCLFAHLGHDLQEALLINVELHESRHQHAFKLSITLHHFRLNLLLQSVHLLLTKLHDRLLSRFAVGIRVLTEAETWILHILRLRCRLAVAVRVSEGRRLTRQHLSGVRKYFFNDVAEAIFVVVVVEILLTVARHHISAVVLLILRWLRGLAELQDTLLLLCFGVSAGLQLS